MMRYAVAIFLGAFLVFQVQPLMGRYVLPWYGGTQGVWTVCLLFFQTMLLGGYLYAHLLSTRVPRRAAGIIHVAFLLAAVLMLPISPDPAVWKPASSDGATIGILLLLLANVGLPGLMVSSTGPLVQRWFAGAYPERSPYRLYALSNVGSVLALVSYPTLVEPNLTLRRQAFLWTGLFVAYAIVFAWCALSNRSSTSETKNDAPVEPGARPRLSLLLFWLALSAIGSAHLMSATNQLCQNVPPVPFLWVLPLTLYLITFILAFDSDRWYHRGVWAALLVIVLPLAFWLLVMRPDPELWTQIAAYLAILFVLCMICHGELARSRPPAANLTSFYLTIATGGAVGGVFVALVAPLLFRGYWEYGITLAGGTLIALITWYRAETWRTWSRRGHLWWPRLVWLGSGAAWLFLAFILIDIGDVNLDVAIASRRNVFGVLSVSRGINPDHPEEGVYRQLMHGVVQHGRQFESPALQNIPTAYYGPDTGMGLAFALHPARLKGDGHLRVGIIGLGVGTSVVYGRAGDVIRCYEINPQVVDLARDYFTFLKQSAATVEIVTGDARVMLERELASGGSQKFDLLIVDAFNSGAVPVHLLTKECAEVYRTHLKPDGILAMHLTNRYLMLYPLARGMGGVLGMEPLYIVSKADERTLREDAVWIVLSANREFLDNPMVKSATTPWTNDDAPPMLWTDDFSSIWKVLR